MMFPRLFIVPETVAACVSPRLDAETAATHLYAFCVLLCIGTRDVASSGSIKRVGGEPQVPFFAARRHGFRCAEVRGDYWLAELEVGGAKWLGYWFAAIQA